MFEQPKTQPKTEFTDQDTAAEQLQENSDGAEAPDQADNSIPSDAGSDLTGMLLSGDTAGLTVAMTTAAANVNLNAILMLTQRGLYTRRIMEQMGASSVKRGYQVCRTVRQ